MWLSVLNISRTYIFQGMQSWQSFIQQEFVNHTKSGLSYSKWIWVDKAISYFETTFFHSFFGALSLSFARFSAKHISVPLGSIPAYLYSTAAVKRRKLCDVGFLWLRRLCLDGLLFSPVALALSYTRSLSKWYIYIKGAKIDLDSLNKEQM